MTNIQMYLAIGIPIVFNFAMMTTFFVLLNGNMNARFDAAEKIWRAELNRVEGIIDARLKHLEER